MLLSNICNTVESKKVRKVYILFSHSIQNLPIVKLLWSSARKTSIKTGNLVIIMERIAGDWLKEWTCGDVIQIILKDLDGTATITSRHTNAPKKSKMVQAKREKVPPKSIPKFPSKLSANLPPKFSVNLPPK
jgi:hypothetical protein